jgi:hypothetical protein
MRATSDSALLLRLCVHTAFRIAHFVDELVRRLSQLTRCRKAAAALEKENIRLVSKVILSFVKSLSAVRMLWS